MVLGSIEPKITSGSLMIKSSGTSGLAYQAPWTGREIHGEGTVMRGISLRVVLVPFQVGSSATIPQLEVFANMDRRLRER
jgi:hypothetical protein